MKSAQYSLLDPCDSHVSVYYEQKQEEEISEHHYCSSEKDQESSVVNPSVEIHEENTISIDLPPMNWHGYRTRPKMLSVTNTGRTILINGHWANSRPYIDGGPLNGNYMFSQIHFHCPSEHEIGGRRYPLEMHVVHYKTSYLTQERAMDEKDGTVVLVYLFKLVKACETPVSQITNLACQLEKLNSRTETTEIALDQLVKPFTSNYYVYWGSVTTRKKSYILQWIINCSLLGVTSEEVQVLNTLIACAGVNVDNKTTQMKPDNDAVFHVGEEDYSLPPLRECSNHDICSICRNQEVAMAACACEWREVCDNSCKRAHQDSTECAHVLSCDCTPQIMISTSCSNVRTGKCPSESIFKLRCRSKSSRKKKNKKHDECMVDSAPNITCESEDDSSHSHACEGKEKRKKKKNKRKKREANVTCSDECVKSCESEEKKICETKTSDSESDCKKSHTKKNKKQDDCCEKSETDAEKQKKTGKGKEKEDEKKRSKSKQKKKKKKNDIDCMETIPSCTGARGKSQKGGSDLCGLQLDSSILLSSTTNTSESEDESNENTPKGDSNVKKNLVSSSVEKNKDVCGDKTPKTKDTKDINVDSEEIKDSREVKDEDTKNSMSFRPSKSHVSSKTNLKKAKNKESCELKSGPEAKPSSAKSKSPLNETSIKKKVSIKKEASELDTPSKASEFKNPSILEKKKKEAEALASHSVEKLKSAVKATAESLKGKRDSKSPGDKKGSCNKMITMRTSKTVASEKAKDQTKSKNKSSSPDRENKQCSNEITTLFEKKPVGKKIEPVGGDGNDVQVNFLLTPNITCSSNPSCLTTSESDFVEDKLSECEGMKKNFPIHEISVNTVSTPISELPEEKEKKDSQTYLLMRHLFRTENKDERLYKCTSQEYHVAVVCDENVIQEYKGKFHPQKLNLKNFESLHLFPSHPEPENLSFQLKDCSVKKESSDQICVKMKFLLKELNIRRILASAENEVIESQKRKPESLINKETQYSAKEFHFPGNSESKVSNSEKAMASRKTEINKDSKLKTIDEKKKQPKSSSSQMGKDWLSSQKCTIRLQKNPLVNSQDFFEIIDTKESSDVKPGKGKNEKASTDKTDKASTDKTEKPSADKGEKASTDKTEKASTDKTEKASTDKTEKASMDKIEKKPKPLYIKRRKTVYFMYDKVEKDETSGKKIFVGSFRTQEEVDYLKKQKSLKENESSNRSDKSEKNKEASDSKFLLSLASKDVDVEVLKVQEPIKTNDQVSSDRKTASTSRDVSGNRKKDLVTLHKYKPKYSGGNHFQKDCKNLLFGKVINNLQKDSENFKELAEIIGVEKEKDPKISIYELQEATEVESEKMSQNSSEAEDKCQTKNTIGNKSGTENATEKNNDNKITNKAPKIFGSKESQAALILIPVEVESLSKIEVILVEHLDDIKKNKKENECVFSLNENK